MSHTSCQALVAGPPDTPRFHPPLPPRFRPQFHQYYQQHAVAYPEEKS
ncbi:hypothetical protein AB0D14_32380 [Streptomyces sp. NPDC048484]